MGYYVTRKNYIDTVAMIDQIITDLKANGFVEVVAKDVYSEADMSPAILEAGIAVDPLAATQSWRIAIGQTKGILSMFSGTSEQLKDTGEITDRAVEHHFCPFNAVYFENPYSYSLSISDHGVALNIYPSKSGGDTKGTLTIRDYSTSRTRHVRYVDGLWWLCGYGDNQMAFSYDGINYRTLDGLTVHVTDINVNGRSGMDKTYAMSGWAYNNMRSMRNDAFRTFDSAGSAHGDTRMVAMTSDGNGTLVAVGYYHDGYGRGRVSTSTNGINWTGRSTTDDGANGTYFHDVTHGDGTFVIVGRYRIHRSTDGVTWTQHAPNTGIEYYHVAHNGKTGVDSLFCTVATDGKIFTSPDGTTWTQKLDHVNGMFGIAWVEADQTWIACGSDGLIIKSDDATGETWTDLTTVGNTNRLSSVCVGRGGRIVAAGMGSLKYSDDNGATWTDATHGSSSSDDYTYMHYNGYNSMTFTTDGNQGKQFMKVGRWDCAYKEMDSKHPKSTEFIDGLYMYSVDHNGKSGNDSVYVAGGNNDYLYVRESDGSWVGKHMNTDWNNTTVVRYSSGKWLAFGHGYLGRGNYASSTDGVNWTYKGYVESYADGKYTTDAWHNGLYGDDSLWIEVRHGGRGAWSIDGETWTYFSTGLGGHSSVRHNGRRKGGMWMIAGSSGQLRVSYDGKTWTTRDVTNLPNRSFHGIAVVDGRFVITTSGREIYVTEDGINFRIVNHDFTHGFDVYNESAAWRSVAGIETDNSLLWFAGGYNNDNRSYRPVPQSSMVCIQRPVGKVDGVVNTDGNAPVIQIGTDIAGEFIMSYLREADILQPTNYRSVGQNSEVTANGLPSFDMSVQPIDSNGNVVAHFLHGFSTERKFYPLELDMVGVVKASMAPALQEIDITMYGDTTPRVFVGVPCNMGADKPEFLTRPIMMINGGGI